MKRFSPLLYGLLVLCLLAACDTSTTNGGEASPSSDSLLVEVPDSVTTASRSIPPAPDLIGTWQLTEMWVGNDQMSVADIGETYLSFSEDGIVSSQAPSLPAIEATYRYQDDAVESDALDGVQEIKELSAGRLVLAYEVDSEEVRCVYMRAQ